MSIFYIKIGLSVIHRHHDVQNNRLYHIEVIIITKNSEEPRLILLPTELRVPLLKALFSKASAKVIHFSETTKFLWIFFEKNLSFYPL